MTILFVDHHDSFVNNLIGIFKKNYTGDIITLQHNELHKFKAKTLCGVVFSPGPGHPSEYKNSISFYKNLPPTIPFLGVCLGYQIMLYTHSAKIEQIGKIPIHGQQVKMRKNIHSRLLPKNALQGYFVLYNSLGIKKNDLSFQKSFHLLAATDEITLAAEHTSLPHIGVQFHPESFASTGGNYFIRCFLRIINSITLL